jgi:hypothetical protein
MRVRIAQWGTIGWGVTARLSAAAVTAVLLLVAAQPTAAQNGYTYLSGQSMHPAFEGWERNEDGSYNFVFGYMNRNWEEAFDLPVGDENSFSPGAEDRGQPTYFQPGRNRAVFRVHVPADFGETDELVWTLKVHGETYKAFGNLMPDYYIDDIVMMSENGSLTNGRSDEEVRKNTPPDVELEGETVRQARVGEPILLQIKAVDDGRPDVDKWGRRGVSHLTEDGQIDLAKIGQPSLSVPGKVNGLHVSWFKYRGSGEVTFDPDQIKVWEDTRPYTNSPWAHGWVLPEPPADGWWVTRATFDEPGTYILRARADDGGLFTDQDITVNVSP